jgi:DnaK suppressor protein
MTHKDVIEFRKTLESAVAELDYSVRRREAIVIEGTADLVDRMRLANEREAAAQALQSASSRHRQVRAALRRIDEGTYGRCIECEERISPRRLAAVPAAALCIRCQEADDCRCAGAGRSLAMAA